MGPRGGEALPTPPPPPAEVLGLWEKEWEGEKVALRVLHWEAEAVKECKTVPLVDTVGLGGREGEREGVVLPLPSFPPPPPPPPLCAESEGEEVGASVLLCVRADDKVGENVP